jgi:hypothetical protein
MNVHGVQMAVKQRTTGLPAGGAELSVDGGRPILRMPPEPQPIAGARG